MVLQKIQKRRFCGAAGQDAQGGDDTKVIKLLLRVEKRPYALWVNRL
jgi:hypothetical protein